jgi:hypothetical protein
VLRLDSAELAAVRRRVHARRALPNAARPYAVEELLAALWAKAASLADPPTHWNRAHFESELRDRREFVEFVLAWWPRLTPAAVLGWLADPRRLARSAGRLLTRAQVDRVAASLAADTPSIQDIALLDELRVLLGEVPRRAGRAAPAGEYRELTTVTERRLSRQPWERPPHYDEYAHVVVDEAQDLSPMQWRMLGRRGRHASWTVVGDAAQSSWGDATEARRAMDAALGRRPRHAFTLSTNYRNSAEIFELAARVVRGAVPDAALPRAVRSTGLLPEHRVVAGDELATTVRAAVVQLLGQVEGTVGVITTMRRRDAVAGWVAGLAGDSAAGAEPAEGAERPAGAGAVASADSAAGAEPGTGGGSVDGAERVQTVGSIEAKGMEYDGVVVVEPDEILAESEAGTRTLYVVLSRATQRLVTVATSKFWLDGHHQKTG